MFLLALHHILSDFHQLLFGFFDLCFRFIRGFLLLLKSSVEFCPPPLKYFTEASLGGILIFEIDESTLFGRRIVIKMRTLLIVVLVIFNRLIWRLILYQDKLLMLIFFVALAQFTELITEFTFGRFLSLLFLLLFLDELVQVILGRIIELRSKETSHDFICIDIFLLVGEVLRFRRILIGRWTSLRGVVSWGRIL